MELKTLQNQQTYISITLQKLELKKESPLKASLRDKINYYTSNSVQDNYKDLKPVFKTSFNQLNY